MESVVNMYVNTQVEHNKVKPSSDFAKEFAEGLIWAQIEEKKELMEAYSKELRNMEDKESFKGQYLETLIWELNSEIKALKNQ